jgi:hypothetical protein
VPGCSQSSQQFAYLMSAFGQRTSGPDARSNGLRDQQKQMHRCSSLLLI